jgi:hypothetical protein
MALRAKLDQWAIRGKIDPDDLIYGALLRAETSRARPKKLTASQAKAAAGVMKSV